MKTPFEILNVPEDADNRMIKKAYLDAVRQFPPEHDPVQFKRIRWAYEQIATVEDRIKYSLFDTSLPEIQDIVADLVYHKDQNQTGLQKNFKNILAENVCRHCKRFNL